MWFFTYSDARKDRFFKCRSQKCPGLFFVTSFCKNSFWRVIRNKFRTRKKMSHVYLNNFIKNGSVQPTSIKCEQSIMISNVFVYVSWLKKACFFVMFNDASNLSSLLVLFEQLLQRWQEARSWPVSNAEKLLPTVILACL